MLLSVKFAMTLRECYDSIGGDYNDVMGRLRAEDRVIRFVSRFPKDPSFAGLCAAMEQGDTETAFREAHTLKGVSQNLSLVRIYKISDTMTEFLRKGDLASAAQLLPELVKDYNEAVTAIQSL